jgi:hypothetical protein
LNLSTINSKTSAKSSILANERVFNFLVNLLSGLVAYTYQPKLPSLDLQPKGLPALPSAIF